MQWMYDTYITEDDEAPEYSDAHLASYSPRGRLGESRGVAISALPPVHLTRDCRPNDKINDHRQKQQEQPINTPTTHDARKCARKRTPQRDS